MSRDWLNLPWREKTWGERGQTILVWVLAWGITIVCFVAACILVLAPMIDNADRYNSGRDRCLKQATNGYEIERCR